MGKIGSEVEPENMDPRIEQSLEAFESGNIVPVNILMLPAIKIKFPQRFNALPDDIKRLAENT